MRHSRVRYLRAPRRRFWIFCPYAGIAFLGCCMGQVCDLQPVAVMATRQPMQDDQVLAYRPQTPSVLQQGTTLISSTPGDGVSVVVRASATAAGRVDLSWSPVATDTQTLILQRSTDGANWSDLQALPATAMSWADVAVQPGRTYQYRLGLIRTSGTECSGPVTVATPWDPTCVATCPSSRPNRAFPSAEGFGALAQGGRGGSVVYVTTLADYDRTSKEPIIEGSLRWALEEMSGPRTVMFKVGGTIAAKTPLYLRAEKGNFVTIAGQSAPGDGIQIRNQQLEIFGPCHDIIIRHIRFRPGYTTEAEWDKDAITLWGKNGQVSSVILDHCSFEWAIDENVNVWDNVDKVTVQYCIVGQGSNFGHHGHDGEAGAMANYSHSAGFLAGGLGCTASDTYLTVHHCFITDNLVRNPLLSAAGPVIHFVNNVVYNWGSYGMTIMAVNGKSPRVNAIGNRYVLGPAYNLTPRRPFNVGPGIEPATIHVSDNLGPFRPDSSLDDWEIIADYLAENTRRIADPRLRRTEPWPLNSGIPVTMQPASTLLDGFASRVGPNYPKLDSVDTRLFEELATGTGTLGFGSSPADLQEHPLLANGVPPADTDSDGMPDGWEVVQKLDPNNSADRNADPDGDGYTNLEEYLNGLVGDN